MKKWYIVQAHAGFEMSVKTALEQRIEGAGAEMADNFGKILVPEEKVIEMRAGQKHRSKRKFFPGYVLVEMEMNDDNWHFVNAVPKVRGFIGGARGEPTPLPPEDAARILESIEAGDAKPRLKIVFEPGDVVRVIEGPFKDYYAQVEEVNYEKNRLLVSVQIFGRPTQVDLQFDQVDKN